MSGSKTFNTIKIGVLGGGQLGRMLIQEAINFDVDIHILENDKNAPCSKIASTFTVGDITNFDDVISFGKDKDVLTVEIEHVNIEALYELEKRGVKVYPQPHILEMIQDKGLQKTFYANNNIPTADFELIDANPNINELLSDAPFVQKLRKGGYDGKGVSIITKKSTAESFFYEPSVKEKLVPFTKELSVIVARNAKGETAVFPTVECEFNEVNLVEFLFSPANISQEIELKAEKLAIEIIQKLQMVGILAVELFLTESGDILVNEIAPRPHNSGHHTIECNVTSQFEQHLRSIINFPLGSTKIIQPGAMINLTGSVGFEGEAIYEGLEEIVSIKGVHPHLYGKQKTKPHRKMGHVTISAASMEEVKSIAHKVRKAIRVIA